MLERDPGAKHTYDNARARGLSKYLAVLAAQGHNLNAQRTIAAYGEARTDRFVRSLGHFVQPNMPFDPPALDRIENAPPATTKHMLPWMSLAILAPMPFLVFHAFLFGLWFYYPSALEVPLLLFFPVLWACMFRWSRFVGFGFTSLSDFSFRPISMAPGSEVQTEQTKNRLLWHEPRVLFSFAGLVEALLWYAVVLGLYWHLHVRFNFPTSLTASGAFGPLLLGYGVFFPRS